MSYDLMNEKAKDIPAGCYGMMCAFSDVMNYISWRHASPMFINFTISTRTSSTAIPSIVPFMENTATGHLRPHAARPRIHRQHSFKEVVFASGASKSELWCQILCRRAGHCR
jgi:autoinducer 2 (AI-2) kinase